MVKELLRPLGLILIMSILGACAGAPPASERGPVESDLSESPAIVGEGAGGSVTQAEEAAYRDLLRKAAESLLGPAASLNQRTALDQFFSRSLEPEELILSDTKEIIAVEEEAELVVVELRVRIRLQELGRRLLVAGISGGQLSDSDRRLSLSDEGDGDEEPAEETTIPEESPTETAGLEASERKRIDPEELELTDLSLSSEEEQRLASMLQNLTFMVYPGADLSLPDAEAVALVNRSIREYGYGAVDYARVESLISEGSDSYMLEVDSAVSIERWAAGKINADLLVIIEGDESRLVLEIVEPLSGDRMVRQNTRSEQGWRQSLETSMVDLLAEAEAAYAAELSQGVPYELEIRNLDEADEIDTFIRELKEEVRSLGRPQVRDGELLLRVGFLGSAEELEALVFELGERLSGGNAFRLISQQRNRLHFEIGR